MTVVEKDNLGDWRLRAVTTLAEDYYPGNNREPIKAGAIVVLTTSSRTRDTSKLHFGVPNIAALTLNSAFREAELAAQCWPNIKFANPELNAGLVSVVDHTSTPILFEYLEHIIVAVGASFQAIEAHANDLIGRHVTAPIPLKRRGEQTEMSAYDIERNVSTDEKLATLLPRITGVDSIKGTRLWELFLEVKKVRDGCIHFKSDDQFPKGGDLQRDHVLYKLLNADPKRFPQTALTIMRHFENPKPPRWLVHLVEKHGCVPSQSKRKRP